MCKLVSPGGLANFLMVQGMNRVITLTLLVTICMISTGCFGNGAAHAEDVTAKIESMPAEERFALIKKNQGMSPQMKAMAIDRLPVSEEQKSTWKSEVGAGNGNASPR